MIETVFDPIAHAFIVRFPLHTTAAMLERWSQAFRASLMENEGRGRSGLLLDTNRHDFESIACLKFMRDFIEEIMQRDKGIDKVAFVQPNQYRQPEIVSQKEAYYSTANEAYQWLRR